MIFFLLLALLPLFEIAVFIAVGSEIGVLNTILVYIMAAIAGIIMIQREGLRTMTDMQEALGQGALPVRELFDSICVFVAGLLLLLPGFISDIAAFLLLIPLARNILRRYAERYFTGEPIIFGQRRSEASHADVIEGEFSRVEDEGPKRLD